MMTLAIDKLLADSCGQIRPISLQVCNLNTRKINKVVISKPYLIIGRNAGCDIVLNDESVTKQHAYLQVLDGRLFCIDQASRTGIFWKDHPRLYGWLDQGEWIQIGPYRITLEQKVGEDHPPAKERRNTAPFLARYNVNNGIEALLTVGDAVELPLTSQVAIIGRSKYSNLELDDEDVSRFHASVIRTSDGNYWLIDLISRTGVKVNQQMCHTALLNDNDLISVGPYLIAFQMLQTDINHETNSKDEPSHVFLNEYDDEINEDDSDETSLPTISELELPANNVIVESIDSTPDVVIPQTVQPKSDLVVKKPTPIKTIESSRVAVPQASLVKAKRSALASVPVARKKTDLSETASEHESWLAMPEEHVLSQMMTQMKQMQKDMYDQMRMNMEMMAEFMGTMQKQQMQMIREELAELGRINLELMQLKQSLATAAVVSQPLTQPTLPAAPEIAIKEDKTEKEPSATKVFKQKPQPPAIQPATSPVEDSKHSHTWISKRISVLETERTSRWEKMKAALMGK